MDEEKMSVYETVLKIREKEQLKGKMLQELDILRTITTVSTSELASALCHKIDEIEEEITNLNIIGLGGFNNEKTTISKNVLCFNKR